MCAACEDELSLSFRRSICEEILTGSTTCHRKLDVCSLVRHQLSLVVSKVHLPHFKALVMQRDTMFLILDFSSKLPGADPCIIPFSPPSPSLSYPKTNPPNSSSWMNSSCSFLIPRFPNNFQKQVCC